jgi:hypothetical protein
MNTNLKLSAFRGDTFTMTLTLKSGTTPFNIAGDTFFLTIKTLRTDADVDAVAQTETTTHTSDAGGLSYVTLTAAETDALLGTYQFDVQWKRSGGTITTICSGTITFHADVTRRTV